MESVASRSPTELNMKAQLPEEPKEDVVKMNGEVNGSYDEEMDISDDPGMITNCTAEVQANGEVEESSLVPSHQNGVETMEVDGDLECDNSKTGNSEFSGIRGNSDLKMEIESFISENEISNSHEDNLNDESRKFTKVVNTESEIQVENVEEQYCVSGVESEVVENDKSDDNIETPEETKQLPSSEENNLFREVKELRNDSLEITLVSRSLPTESVQKAEESGEPFEALNMSVSKNSGEGKTEVTKSSNEGDDDDRGSPKTPDKNQDDDLCADITTEKSSKKKKTQPINVTPRRSSRNLNKTKSYADKDLYIEELDRKSDDDIEEVIPTDPLADDNNRKSPKKNTIVVSDTKRLVEIAAGSKQNRGGKKEPTLVIIDTNSILSGKGAVAVSQSSLPQMTITPTPPRNAFSMLPINVSSSIYPQKHVKVAPPPVQAALPPPQPKPVILPTLTDDMYVVEAPSFIVPYVYEKPPVTSLKDYVIDLDKSIKEQKLKEEKEKQKKKKESYDKDADNQILDDDKSKESNAESENEKQEISEQEEKEILKVKEGESSEKDDTNKNDSEISEKVKEESEKQEKANSDKSDTETDEETKDGEEDRKRENDIEILTDRTKKKNDSYFDNPLGKFFMQIGVNLVQEYVQTDLLRNQKRKRDRDGKNCPPEVHMAINSLLRTLECSKENNEPFKLELKKCSLCSFKTESELVMAHHLETPHMRNYVYRCNFCTMEVRSPHDILFHMEAVHNVRGRLERAPAFHQCPNCPFEDNQKGKLSRHLLSCAKKYKPERNQEPPLDWEPPAKIPRIRGSRPTLSMPGAMYPLPGRGIPNSLSRMPSPPSVAAHSMLSNRGRGRPPISINRYIGDVRGSHLSGGKVLSQYKSGAMFRSTSNTQPPVLLPTPYQITNNQIFQSKMNSPGVTAKLLQQPSISITPLPRQAAAPTPPSGPIPGSSQQAQFTKPGRPPGSSKATFVICEICDGYIKDLEQLRNHMQWIHKVKIHPKMIYNRPPLNCQKCQFRFFTDQGLERHLLGSHGLVTSSMQENANKGKDGGRCPVCGRVYQWKLLNHVARDHNMALKPAHLSYKCTVCTATFGMYKQFENHVYSAHSVVAKRVMPDKKPSTPQPSTSGGSSSESLLKPLKINDEITIIPQPARAKTRPAPTPQKTNNKV